MHRRLLFALLATSGCSSSETATPTFTSPLADAGDALGMAEASAPSPACIGDPTACLSGSVVLSPLFTLPFAHATVALYRVMPGSQAPEQTVTADGSGRFALSNLDPWAHYFLEVSTSFDNHGQKATLGTPVGPFVVPSDSTPITVVVQPIALTLAEVGTSTGAAVELASVHVFNPSTGAEMTPSTGSDVPTVAATAGGVSVPLTWSPSLCGSPSFCGVFPSATMAQSVYTVTAQWPVSASDAGSVSFGVASGGVKVAQGAIAAPLADASLSVDASLQVSWIPEPGADYETVEIFQNRDGSFVPTYASPVPDDPDASVELVAASAVPSAGQYLLNVEYASVACAASADAGTGCVVSTRAAAGSFTAR